MHNSAKRRYCQLEMLCASPKFHHAQKEKITSVAFAGYAIVNNRGRLAKTSDVWFLVNNNNFSGSIIVWKSSFAWMVGVEKRVDLPSVISSPPTVVQRSAEEVVSGVPNATVNERDIGETLLVSSMTNQIMKGIWFAIIRASGRPRRGRSRLTFSETFSASVDMQSMICEISSAKFHKVTASDSDGLAKPSDIRFLVKNIQTAFTKLMGHHLHGWCG